MIKLFPSQIKPYLFLFLLYTGALHSQVIGIPFLSTAGTTQTFVIPSCTSNLSLTVIGGAGANVGWSTASGAMVYVVMTPTPGEVLYINSGGIGTGSVGGWNGGGNGGVGSANFGGGGGGATDIRIGGNALSNRVLVMGGGGGSGSSPQISAHGGAASAVTSISCPPLLGYYLGGAGGGGGSVFGGGGNCSGGTATSYGTGGAGGGINSGGSVSGGGNGGFGQAGSLGAGGDGGGFSPVFGGSTGGVHGGGGGGGGYYGGAGGMSGAYPSSGFPAAGGGGGGSSYINTSIFYNIVPGGIPMSGGNVYIQFTYTSSPVTVSGPTAVCGTNSISLNGSGVSTYTWLPVNNFVGSNASSITSTPSVTTTYTVMGTNTVGCISSTVLTVNVFTAVPSLSVSNTSSATGGVCPGQSVTISAMGASSYTWAGGLTPGVAFIPPSVGQTYTVTGSNACGTSSAVTSSSIHPAPAVSGIATPTSVCLGNTLTLNGVGASTYTWSHPIPSVTVLNGQPFTPTTSLTYTVRGTSLAGCTNSAALTVSVISYPVLGPSASPATICLGSSSLLQTIGTLNYTWMPNNISNNPLNVSPTVNTTYTLHGANNNCISTVTLAVKVNTPSIISGIVTPTLVCPSSPAILNGSGASTYSWSFGNNVYAGNNLTINPSASGVCTLSAFDGTCTSTSTVLISTYPPIPLTITTSPSIICAGQSATLSGSGALTHTWTGSTIATNSIIVSPLISTSYTLSGTDSHGCIASLTKNLTVNQNPTVSATSNQTFICAGGNATITASGAQNYQWSANANNAVSASTSVSPQISTIYTVSGSYLSTGCASTNTVAIEVLNSNLSVTVSPTLTCFGDPITFIASGGNPNSYTWTGSSSTAATLQITPPSSTILAVSVTTSSNFINCVFTKTVSVAVLSNPTIIASADRTILCAGEFITLTANGASTYTWNNNLSGATISVTPQAGTVSYTAIGTSTNGCKNTATVEIEVSECTGINKRKVSEPNVTIYPNPNNGYFTIEANCSIQLSLVNELGQLIKLIHLSENNHYNESLSDLTKGVYFISGQKDGVHFNQKIIICK